jgi:glycogen phosphorylase
MSAENEPAELESNGHLPRVAYFCMEYGLTPEFPIYSGGLGVLAGDFVKSAGDLKLPVVALGLRWSCGTAQMIGPGDYPVDEWHEYRQDWLEDTGVRVRVRVRSREVECLVWKVTRFVTVPLYLIEPVHRDDRWIIEHLYDTRPDCRVAQEMLLGIGGIRALPRLGHQVDIYHFNEGHAVFAGLELIASRMANNASFQEALAEARRKIVFTTHTPVPAGNETHPVAELKRLGAGLELVDAEVRAVGGDPFNMTVAGLRLSHRANAVSKLHAETARDMWRDVPDAAPIIAVTNGVHRGTWQSPAIGEASGDPEQLWKEHVRLKQELLERVQASNGVYLEPGILTIGFARRAAAYKRADLIIRDPSKIEPLLEKRRIQIIFSGKSHAADNAGKNIVATLVAFSRRWPQSVVFLENYDMSIARALVQGADVWLNNPYRPQEASGTSGMKAALNGVLNLSILDGWWPEGCEHGVNGWAIGRRPRPRRPPVLVRNSRARRPRNLHPERRLGPHDAGLDPDGRGALHKRSHGAAVLRRAVQLRSGRPGTPRMASPILGT